MLSEVEKELHLTSKEFYPTVRTLLVPSHDTTVVEKGRVFIVDKNNIKRFAKYYIKVKLKSGYSNILIFPTLERREAMVHKFESDKRCGVLYCNEGLIYDKNNKNIYLHE